MVEFEDLKTLVFLLGFITPYKALYVAANFTVPTSLKADFA